MQGSEQVQDVGSQVMVPLSPMPVEITAEAAVQVKDAMGQEDLDMASYFLRIGVTGGGCSGLQYLLDFTDRTEELDFIAEQHGVQVAIDPFSAAHLRGTVIDYVDSLTTSGFKFENPNIERSCGCGSSFQT